MPLATIHTRSLVPDFIIAPVLSFGQPTSSSDEGSDSESGSLAGSSGSSKATTPGPDVIHPLHVSTILQKVFGYLSYWQQKKCRLVSRTWNAELLQLMRKRSKANLTRILTSIVTSSSTPSPTLPLSSSPLPILQSLNLVCTSFIIEDESQDIGYFLKQSNLSIKYVELRNISWNLAHVHKYILQQLPYLEELRIPIQCALPLSSASSSISSSSQFQLEKAESPTFTTTAHCEKYPNLKVIVVTYTLQDLHIYSRQDTSISSLLDILQNAPNLEEIYYPNISQFTSPFENPARVLFKNIIYNGSMSLSKLSSLKIDTFLRNEDLYTLAERNLPLRSLQLTLTPDIKCDDLYELLYSVEPTLNVLAFTFRDGFRLSKRFPQLENLGNMSVIIWNGYLDHLAEIPKLKNLVVVLMEINVEMIASGTNCGGKTPISFAEASGIKQLEIHAVPKGSEMLVMKTIRLSPWNLKRLTIDHATDQYLRLIFRSLRCLEELLILYGDWTETGLTGIPKEFCKQDILTKEFYATGLKEFPGITDLKNLRSLILTGIITDISLILGVTKCKKMNQLELIARRNSKVSDISLMKIADTMDLHYLRMTNFAPNVNVSESGLQYLIKRFSGRELYLND